MSLESAIQENTEALRLLINLLTAKSVEIPPAATLAPPPLAPSSRASAKAADAQQEIPANSTPATSTTDELAYDVVRESILDLSKKKGKDAALAVLAPYGVTSGLDLKPEQYQQVVADIQSALRLAS